MAKVTWDKLVKNAYDIFANRDKYTYNLECCGELAESDRAKALYEYYYEYGKTHPGFNNGNVPTKPYAEWLKENKGKRCFDCSGFVDYCLGYTTHKYASGYFPKSKINESMAAGVAGSLLWKSGHIGIDCGYGVFLDFPKYNESCRLSTHRTRPDYWTQSFECSDVDYTGADNR